MHRYGGGVGGSDRWLPAPHIAMSDPTSSQRSLLGGPYHDQTLGPPSAECASSPHGSHGRVDFVVGEELAVDEGFLRRSSVIDAAARQLQMLSINNGASEGASTSGPHCGPCRPKPGSPAYASSIYSRIYQSTELNHLTVNGTGPSLDLFGEIDGTTGTNTHSFWHNWDGYPPGFESALLKHHAEYHPSGSSLFHDSGGELDGSVCTDTSYVWSNGHSGVAASLSIPVYSSLRSLQGRIVELACHWKSCKTLQNTIKQGLGEDEIEILFKEIIDHVAVLMTHRYANYIVQQLVELCSEEQWHIIISMLTRTGASQIVDICFDLHGTRVVQKLLDNANSPHQISALLLAIAPHVVELTKNAHGQYVILRCLEKFSDEVNEFLYTEVANNCYDIATHKDGCCAMQKYVDFARGNRRKLLVDAIIAHALYLSLDYFGNYVVQHVLKLKMPGVTARLISQFEARFSYLSCNKYASNVVESCLKESLKDEFFIIIDELLRDPKYIEVFMDQYGNYVFTLAVEVSKERRLDCIFNIFQTIIRENAESMNGHFYGKKALTRLGKKKLLLPGTVVALRRC